MQKLKNIQFMFDRKKEQPADDMEITIDIRDGEVQFLDEGTFIGQLKYDIHSENTALIHSVYLFPEYRGRKILRHNFEAIISHIREQGMHRLILRCLNDDERQIWKKLGFIEKAYGEFELLFTNHA